MGKTYRSWDKRSPKYGKRFKKTIPRFDEYDDRSRSSWGRRGRRSFIDKEDYDDIQFRS